MQTATIDITLASLWAAYSNHAASGRFACPVTTPHGTATHIYRGFGAIRLENITGAPQRGKGFQGEEIAFARIPHATTTRVRIND